jgi:PmbA protein
MDLFKVPEYAVKKAQSLGANDVVVSAGRGNNQQIKFVNNEIAIIKDWNVESAGIFLEINKRIISANIKNFAKQEIDHTLNKLIRFVKLLPPKEDFYGIAKGPFKYSKVDGLFDKRLVNFNKSVDVVQTAINAGLSGGAKRVTGVFEVSNDSNYAVSSNGLNSTEKGTNLSLSVRALLSKESSGHKVFQSNVLTGFNPAKLALQAGRFAKDSINPKQIKVGKYDILFLPLPLADLFGCVAGATSIDSFESGMSFFNKVGQTVASPKFTLYDWANMPRGVDSYAFDSEGTPSQKTATIKNGVFKTYLHNYSTAHKYKTKTTGNAGLGSPSPSNTYVVPGRASQKSMIEQIKHGLIITNLWYTTFQNYQTGNFSTIPRDAIFYVENGKVKHAVKDIRITENLINVLKNIKEVGKDREQVYSWAAEPPSFGNNVVTPSVLCKNLNITKSRG